VGQFEKSNACFPSAGVHPALTQPQKCQFSELQRALLGVDLPRRVPGDPLDVILDDHYRQLVGYVIEEQVYPTGKVDRVPTGTVFFMSVRDVYRVFVYAVTCKHLIRPSEPGTAWPLYVRINHKDGKGFSDIPCPLDSWTLSETSDVAVCELRLNAECDYWAYDIRFADFPWPISVGVEVFMVGLFVCHPGDKRVEALIRTGSIARESTRVPVRVDIAKQEDLEIDAFLIESRSWGGESGSPVFTYRHKQELHSQELGRLIQGAASGYAAHADIGTKVNTQLVGMLHGHFPVDLEGTPQNSGVAIVIPACELASVINDPKLVHARNEAIAEHKAQLKSRPGSSQ